MALDPLLEQSFVALLQTRTNNQLAPALTVHLHRYLQQIAPLNLWVNIIDETMFWNTWTKFAIQNSQRIGWFGFVHQLWLLLGVEANMPHPRYSPYLINNIREKLLAHFPFQPMWLHQDINAKFTKLTALLQNIAPTIANTHPQFEVTLVGRLPKLLFQYYILYEQMQINKTLNNITPRAALCAKQLNYIASCIFKAPLDVRIYVEPLVYNKNLNFTQLYSEAKEAVQDWNVKANNPHSLLKDSVNLIENNEYINISLEDYHIIIKPKYLRSSIVGNMSFSFILDQRYFVPIGFLLPRWKNINQHILVSSIFTRHTITKSLLDICNKVSNSSQNHFSTDDFKALANCLKVIKECFEDGWALSASDANALRWCFDKHRIVTTENMQKQPLMLVLKKIAVQKLYFKDTQTAEFWLENLAKHLGIVDTSAFIDRPKSSYQYGMLSPQAVPVDQKVATEITLLTPNQQDSDANSVVSENSSSGNTSIDALTETDPIITLLTTAAQNSASVDENILQPYDEISSNEFKFVANNIQPENKATMETLLTSAVNVEKDILSPAEQYHINTATSSSDQPTASSEQQPSIIAQSKPKSAKARKKSKKSHLAKSSPAIQHFEPTADIIAQSTDVVQESTLADNIVEQGVALVQESTLADNIIEQSSNVVATSNVTTALAIVENKPSTPENLNIPTITLDNDAQINFSQSWHPSLILTSLAFLAWGFAMINVDEKKKSYVNAAIFMTAIAVLAIAFSYVSRQKNIHRQQFQSAKQLVVNTFPSNFNSLTYYFREKSAGNADTFKFQLKIMIETFLRLLKEKPCLRIRDFDEDFKTGFIAVVASGCKYYPLHGKVNKKAWAKLFALNENYPAWDRLRFIIEDLTRHNDPEFIKQYCDHMKNGDFFNGNQETCRRFFIYHPVYLELSRYIHNFFTVLHEVKNRFAPDSAQYRLLTCPDFVLPEYFTDKIALLCKKLLQLQMEGYIIPKEGLNVEVKSRASNNNITSDIYVFDALLTLLHECFKLTVTIPADAQSDAPEIISGNLLRQKELYLEQKLTHFTYDATKKRFGPMAAEKALNKQITTTYYTQK